MRGYRQFKERYISPQIGTTYKDLTAQVPLAFPAAAPRRDRFDILRTHISKVSKVLEIGPLAQPIAPKSAGYNTYSVDKAKREELLEQFKHIELDKSLIEEVDFVWGDTELTESVPSEHHGSFDVIVLSHVLEHMPDPLTFLDSCQRLLKPGGYVTIALPDKRFCFDIFRPLSTTGAWLDANQSKRTSHTDQTLFEYSISSVARQGAINWTHTSARAEQMTFVKMSLYDAYGEYFGEPSARPQRGYVDCHAWVFTPASFALIVHECHAIGLCGLALDNVTSARDGEFFANLKFAPNRAISHHERLQLLALAAQEQVEGFKALTPAKPDRMRELIQRIYTFLRR